MVVNAFNLGRFWEEGPQRRLYLPGALLKPGKNELLIFETEGKHKATVNPVIRRISGTSDPEIKSVIDSQRCSNRHMHTFGKDGFA